MADVAKTDKGSVMSTKPDRPDEEVYKKELEAAEKAHEDAKARLVGSLNSYNGVRY
jgi:hypothetical protein